VIVLVTGQQSATQSETVSLRANSLGAYGPLHGQLGTITWLSKCHHHQIRGGCQSTLDGHDDILFTQPVFRTISQASAALNIDISHGESSHLHGTRTTSVTVLPTHMPSSTVSNHKEVNLFKWNTGKHTSST